MGFSHTIINSKTSRSRNSSIELLRIIAAYMIVLRHFVGGNAFDVWKQSISLSKVYLEGIIYPSGKVGVVLFFLISAWFLCDSATDFKSTLRRAWILEREILFYSLILTIFFMLFNPHLLSIKLIVGAVLPVSTNLWWYATSYQVFLIVLPFLNLGLKALGKTRHRVCCLVLLFMWSVSGGLVSFISYNMVPQNVLIFLYLYVLVSYWRWYVPSALSHKNALILIITGYFITVIGVVAMSWMTSKIGKGEHLQTMLGQNEWMLPVMMIAFGLFSIFKEKSFSFTVINFCAKSMFAVYLISAHPAMPRLLWHWLFDMTNVYHSVMIVPYSLGVCFLCLCACILIDIVRRILFDLFLKQNDVKFFDKLYDFLKTKFSNSFFNDHFLDEKGLHI